MRCQGSTSQPAITDVQGPTAVVICRTQDGCGSRATMGRWSVVDVGVEGSSSSRSMSNVVCFSKKFSDVMQWPLRYGTVRYGTESACRLLSSDLVLDQTPFLWLESRLVPSLAIVEDALRQGVTFEQRDITCRRSFCRPTVLPYKVHHPTCKMAAAGHVQLYDVRCDFCRRQVWGLLTNDQKTPFSRAFSAYNFGSRDLPQNSHLCQEK